MNDFSYLFVELVISEERSSEVDRKVEYIGKIICHGKRLLFL